MRTRLPAPKALPKLLDMTSLTSPRYLLYVSGTAVALLGLFTRKMDSSRSCYGDSDNNNFF